jgi:hypothetical protein
MIDKISDHQVNTDVQKLNVDQQRNLKVRTVSIIGQKIFLSNLFYSTQTLKYRENFAFSLERETSIYTLLFCLLGK